MHLKQEIYCFAIFILYIFATIVGWCESTGVPQQRDYNLDFHHPKTRGGRGQPPNRRGSKRLQSDTSPAGAATRLLLLLHPDNLAGRDGIRNKTSAKKEKRVKTRDKVRQTPGEWVYVTPSPPTEGCVTGDVEPATLGKFYISGQLEVNTPSGNYQADSAAPGKWTHLTQLIFVLVFPFFNFKPVFPLLTLLCKPFYIRPPSRCHILSIRLVLF